MPENQNPVPTVTSPRMPVLSAVLYIIGALVMLASIILIGLDAEYLVLGVTGLSASVVWFGFAQILWYLNDIRSLLRAQTSGNTVRRSAKNPSND